MRRPNPASPSIIDITQAPPAPFTAEQRERAHAALRGIRVLQFMGMNDDYIVQDAAARLRDRVVVLP